MNYLTPENAREIASFKPNRDQLAKWAQALRDPARKQARSVLVSCNDAMCCLGVLSDINEMPHQRATEEDEAGFWFGNSVETELPDADFTAKWFGIDVPQAHRLHNIFSNANDEDKATFTQIADFIDQILEPEYHAELRNWSAADEGDFGAMGGFRISGAIHNDIMTGGKHPFADGTRVTTSRVKSITNGIALTNSGTRYLLVSE